MTTGGFDRIDWQKALEQTHARIAELEHELADSNEAIQVAHQMGYTSGYADARALYEQARKESER